MLFDMKCQWILSVVALCIATCYAKPDAGAYAKPDFGTYQPILDRMPFGAPSDTTSNLGPVSNPEEQRRQEALARQINMSAVNIMPDGRTAIGFTDLSAKPPVNHYLHIGESSDGWTVVDANYDEETATIKKGEVEIALKLGKGLIESPAPGAGGRLGPALAAVNQGVAAGAQVNALSMSASPGVLAPAPGLPPGLRRETRSSPATPNMATGRATVSSAVATPVPPTAGGSYRERLDQRVESQQIAKEKAEQEQKEALKQLAAAAAQEEIRKREREAAEAAEEQQGLIVDDVDE